MSSPFAPQAKRNSEAMRMGNARSQSQCTIETGTDRAARASLLHQMWGRARERNRGKPRTQAASRNEVKAEQRKRRAAGIRGRMAVAIPLPIEKPRTETGLPGTRVSRK